MKHLLRASIVFFACILIFAGCAINDKQTESESTTDAEKSETTSASTTVTTEDTPHTTGNKPYTPSYGGDEPSHTIDFRSIDDIRLFIKATAMSGDEYEKYWEEHQKTLPVSQPSAKKVAEELQHSLCPVISEKDAQLYGCFYVDRNEMDYVIEVGDIRYRFTYYFDQKEYQYDESKYITTLKFDQYEVPIYMGDQWILGTTTIGNATVTIAFSTLDVQKVNEKIVSFAPVD